ncbi:MAG: Vitamin B12 transporter BtuB [Chroococcidiopsis cubana SAG 39.79]|uniref:Ferrichrome-iron receptor n=1 Tax=Chroococcidiopsis cubana SAG 39.79 TaxID=388085 RepID=A0AB37U8A5_9CYAN|nr:TonB-dependent receptor [Chroococcidiopsis cubana]MDZ4877056.1 Vitamin B12 transporter BtuB [Chroococcidiopsis cubana SAG 39.79]PSB61014.1 TonB-dependent siderophore receptor [Chroococcidiopsis cubana CCALA 043]RUS98543.1 ferrichrome-iron receptor [Chroococcidiopsis cubana SAG 39.79]
MKQQQLWQILLVTGSVWLSIAIGATAQPVPSWEVQSKSVSRILRDSPPTQNLPRLSELERPITSAQTLVQSPAPVPAPETASAIMQVTAVKANPTDKGVEVILQTTLGEQLPVVNRSAGNSYIADIPNAQLRLPSGEAFVFRSRKPITGITEITVTNADANTIRVTVTGEAGVPTVELFDSPEEGLIFGVVSAVASTPLQQQPPTQLIPEPVEPGSETKSDKPALEGEEESEIVVTGEQEEGYRVPNSSTGTRTDTPLRDIPQSIQVVPQEVLRDQQVTRLEDALRNVPGVNQNFNFGPLTTYTIRGFEATATNLLRDGLLDPLAGESTELSSIDRVEVLKGPASVLFGLGNPGGSINLVSKRPLSEPFYAIDATVGTYSYYRGAIDLSAPLDDSKTALYRLNTAYRNSGSFVDFYNGEHFNVSPVVSVAIGERTNLTLEGEYIYTRDSYASGVPVIGSVLSNPNGEVSRDRNFGEPSDVIEQKTTRLGYQLEHKFSDNWLLRNAFRFTYRDYTDLLTLPGSLDADNRTFNRVDREYDLENTNYALSANVVGKFSTGSIQHQLLFGVDFNSLENLSPIYAEREANPIDIFDPVYDRAKIPGAAVIFESSERALTNSWGIYLQDQVTLTDGLKLLLGMRFDTFDRKYEEFITNTESSGSDSAFSPRFGIVYQPIPAISLYASYTSSFTPPGGTFFFGVDSTLESERGNQYEVGVKADLNERLSATLALFDLTRTNVSTEDPNRPGFQIQVGEQNSQGIELNLAGKILSGWNIYAGYAFIDARITEDNTFTPGNRLPNTADHSFNLWTSYEIQQGNLQGLGAGFGLFFVGDRAGDLDNSYEVPGYVRTDAAIFYNQDRFRVALNFKNLFNINYFESALNSNRVYYGQPFTLQGTVSWQF